MDERKDMKSGVVNELKKFFCKVSVYLEKGKEGLVHYSKVLTIKSDISLLKNDRRVVYRKVGEDAYKAIKEGRIDLPESKDAIEKIDRIEDSIKEKTKEVEKLGEEGHSLKAEKEIVKTKEEVEVKEDREEKAQKEPPIVTRKATTGEKKKTRKTTTRKTVKKKENKEEKSE